MDEKAGAEKFTRLATKRMNQALKAIRVLGNCFGYGYVYTPEQAKQVFDAIDTELTAIENKSKNTKEVKEETVFEFVDSGS